MSARVKEAVRVIEMEAAGLRQLAESLRNDADLADAFSEAVEIIMGVGGHLIVAGVGKSGHVGQKLAASFASTGTPSFFLHPTEASHGDLGMITERCAVLAISNSGESRELVDVLHYCRKISVPVIGITRSANSLLGRGSRVVLQLPSSEEACANGLAPTTSTTNTLALGDALVIATMVEKGVSESDFGLRHPGGKLGRGLQTVGDWMSMNPHTPPCIAADAGMEETVMSVSKGQNGCAAVVDHAGAFLGMITDGDLRRAMTPDMFTKTAADIMTSDPLTLSEDMLMGTVVKRLTDKHLGNAFIVRDGRPVGVMNMKRLTAQGYV